MCKVTKTPAMHVLRGTPERSQHESGLGFRIWGLGFGVCEKDTSNLLYRAHFTCKEYFWVLLLDKAPIYFRPVRIAPSGLKRSSLKS